MAVFPAPESLNHPAGACRRTDGGAVWWNAPRPPPWCSSSARSCWWACRSFRRPATLAPHSGHGDPAARIHGHRPAIGRGV